MNAKWRVVSLWMIILALFVSGVHAASPAGTIGRGVAAGMKTTGGSGLWHLGPCIASQPGQLNVAFAVIKKPRSHPELLYFIIYKDPSDDDKSVGIDGFKGRSNDSLVDVTHRLDVGGQQLNIAYRIELDRATRKVTHQSLQVGEIQVAPGDGQVFLADFTVKPFTLRQITVQKNAFRTAFNRRNGMDNDIRAASPRHALNTVADRVFRTVESLKQRSLAVRSFLAADPPATPVAQSSGDPRNLSPAEVRSIWDRLMEVEVPKEQDANRLTRKPFTSSVPARELDDGRFRTKFGSLDLYITARHAELASELGLRAWSVDFDGGPLHVWWEVDKDGDVVVPLELPGVVSDQYSVFGICRATKGRMIFWYLPGVAEEEPTAQGQPILNVIKAQRGFASSVAHRCALHVVDGPTIERSLHIPETSGPWFWSQWNGVKFKRHSEPGPFHVVDETTLLDIEATEANPPAATPPRRLRLQLKAKPMN